MNGQKSPGEVQKETLSRFFGFRVRIGVSQRECLSDDPQVDQIQPHRGDSLRDDGPVSLEYALRKYFNHFRINK